MAKLEDNKKPITDLQRRWVLDDDDLS